jgi:hypothetical protein
MDKKLIAQKDYSEVSTVVNMLRYKNPTEEINRVTVKDIFWNCGRSRVVAYEIFMLMGYNVARHPKPTGEQAKKIKEVSERMGL